MDKTPFRILIPGGSGAIGQAMINELLKVFPQANVHATYNRSAIELVHERLQWHQLDVRDPDKFEQLAGEFDSIDWILNCVGYLHGEFGGPEKSIKSIDSDFFIENMTINTLPTLLLAKHFSRALKNSHAPKLATISGRVGSIEDNRLGGWYSYRISKAALNMALKTISIEWKHSHPNGCVTALHPGTNDTPLSKPFQANVAAENLFDPAYTAAHFVKLLTRIGPADSGQFRAWDGEIIPW